MKIIVFICCFLFLYVYICSKHKINSMRFAKVVNINQDTQVLLTWETSRDHEGCYDVRFTTDIDELRVSQTMEGVKNFKEVQLVMKQFNVEKAMAFRKEMIKLMNENIDNKEG